MAPARKKEQLVIVRRGPHQSQQRGATSIEYALMASFIAMAIIIGVTAVGGANLSNWSTVADKVVAAIQAALGL